MDTLKEPLRHKITLQVMKAMDNSSNAQKKSSVYDNSNGNCNRIRSSSSFDADHNLDGMNESLNRYSAEEMDEQRQTNIAYEYLCHLEEAKKWIETCIREELPSTTECEENLRNGVYLGKLSNFFCPEKVPFKKIYDKDQSKYEMYGLQFRHTDNINHWFNAMEHIGLPKIFFPETTDIYDKKNMPRVIYCLHALSLYLYKLGIATQIQDLYGVAKFTEEEITTMAIELQKYGLKLPEFKKIGGILANEMPIDEAALHAAILAINDAIEKKDLDVLLNDLKLCDAHLVNIVNEYIKFYHELMHEAKINKSENCKDKNTNILDVYDELLTQTEIQSLINKINDYADSVINLLVDRLSDEISECITKQDPKLLLHLLKSKCSPFKNIIDEHIDWYMAQLTQEKESKLNEKITMSKEIIQNAINVANANAEKLDKCLKLLDELNNCLMNNKRDEFILILSQHAESFHTEEEIDGDYAGSLYFVEFKFIYDDKETSLDIDDFMHGIKVLNVVVDINKAIDISSTNIDKNKSECLENDAILLLNRIKHPNAHLQEIINDNLKIKYLKSLIASKQFKNTAISSSSTSMNMSDSKNNISLSDSGHAESEILQCNLLTHGEIQECILQSNSEYKIECHAIELINGDLNSDNFNKLVEIVKNTLPNGDMLNIIESNYFLYNQEIKKSKNFTGKLDIDDFKSIINMCNSILENALNMTKTMLVLNQIDQTKKPEIIDLISDKSLGIKIYSDASCVEMYYQTFKDLRRICARQPSICTVSNHSSSEYFWNKTVEEFDFYLSLKNPAIYSWLIPMNFTEATNLITRTILKKAIEATNQKFELNLLYLSKESLIIQIQALARGFKCRQAIIARAKYLVDHTNQVIQIQSWWRMTREKNLYKKRLSHLKINLNSIVMIQSGIRMWLCRKEFLKRKEFYKSNEANIVKIQAYIRAKNARNDYKSLIGDQVPSLRIVRKFVHLLEHNNTDFTEEIELQELKRQIMTSIKTNKNLEHDLDMMDVKIGLLIKNRITLQDVLIQHKRLRKYKEDIENNQTSQVKQLSKENHEKMELYQNLFYLLQTRPNYLAKLLFTLPTTNSSKFIESVVLQLFNYGANSREEYLLLKLFTASLEQEIESKVDKISDIITGTPLVIKVIVSLYRKHRGENVLRNLLNPIIEEFLNDKNVHLCLNPCELYKNWINKLESDTGKPSGLPYDITSRAALEHEEIRQQLDANLKMVKMYTAKFLHLILKSIKKIPYGLRYLARVLRNKLKSKFPMSTDREILKIIGNLIYYRFINSAICSPDAYDVIDSKAGQSLNSDQRKNLACISKHLNLISMSKGYGDTENAHLACLNPFIKESHELIRNYFQEICQVPEADEFFGINEYSDLIVLTKPIVYMTVQEIGETHKILVENLDKIAPEPTDPLREIFSILKHEPDLDSFTSRPLSTVSLNKSADSSKSDSLNRSSFSKNTQLCLTLTNRFPPNTDERNDTNNIMIRTKRLIIEILHCQHGEDLIEILSTHASIDQEKYHEFLLKKREKNIKLLSPEYQKLANSLNLPLEQIKLEVLRNVTDLKKNDGKSSLDCEIYQEIISRIAQDIRNQRKHRQRRQKELVHLLEVHSVLNKKSELLKEQVSYYNEYVKACLDSLNSKKGRNKNPFKRHQKEKLVGSVKYTAAKLHDKGVILEIPGFQQKQFKNVMFEISTTEEPGIFEVTAKILGKTMEKFELIFQDLLQMQYEGLSIMNMSGFAKINVNLLIFLLNKKFYGK